MGIGVDHLQRLERGFYLGGRIICPREPDLVSGRYRPVRRVDLTLADPSAECGDSIARFPTAIPRRLAGPVGLASGWIAWVILWQSSAKAAETESQQRVR